MVFRAAKVPSDWEPKILAENTAQKMSPTAGHLL